MGRPIWQVVSGYHMDCELPYEQPNIQLGLCLAVR